MTKEPAALANARTFVRTYLTEPVDDKDPHGPRKPCKLTDSDVATVVPVMVTADVLNSVRQLVEMIDNPKHEERDNG